MKKARCTAVVLAAGVGRRMLSDVAKQYLLLDGKPVLWYALNVFEKSNIIDDIILVVGKGEIPYCKEEVVDRYGFCKISDVIEGGAERYLSVWEALKVIRERQCGTDRRCSGINAVQTHESDVIFIHDGARPFVTEEIILDTYEAVLEYEACVTGVPAKDTIKISDADGFAVQTPNRKTVWQVQTPQVFRSDLIIEAYSELIENLDRIREAGIEITDDAMVAETIKEKPVKLVKGSYSNIKITTPEDMVIARSLL